ncbi:MAG TPA: MG2 domain-containing protein [Candidatus Hydrogenedentes bacterium]|nr:MG2 domain-containing protein [Candidatus Hydrogenedentota bacterium]
MWHLTNHRSILSYLALIFLCTPLLTALGCSQPATSVSGPDAKTASQTPASPPPLAAETQQGVLTVVGVVPLAGEPLVDQIVFFFDAPVQIAPEAGFTDPFTIEPAVEGTFRVNRNFAAFQAADGFDEDVVYTVALNPDLVSETGARIPEDAREHNFASFAFEPQNMWEIEEQADRVVLGIMFPSTVNPDALRQHLVVENLEGQSVTYEIEPGEEGGIRLVFAGGLPAPIRIKVLKGLTDESGAAELAEDHLFAYPQEPFFAVASVQWGKFEGPKKEIVLQFTKPVPAASLTEGVSITRADNQSAVPFEVVSQAEASEHRLSVEIPETEYPSIQVKLAKGMEGSQKRVLLEDYSATLDTRPEPLKVTSVRWGSTDGDTHTLFLRFSHPVRSDALSSRLKLSETAMGNELPFEVQGEELSIDKALTFQPERRDKVDVTLAIEAGLPGDPNAALPGPYQYEMARPAPPLQIEDTWWSYDYTQGQYLSMRLNVVVNSQELEKYLTFSPAVEDISITPEGNSYYRVYGTFRSKTSYQLRIAEGVPYLGGGKSQAQVSRELQTDEIPAYIGFNQDGKYYFPTRATSALEVTSRNVDKVAVDIYRMFPSNVAVAIDDMGMKTSSNDYWEAQQRGSNFIYKWSEKIVSTELEMPRKQDYLVSAPIDLEKLLPSDKRGVFCVEARAQNGPTATKIVMFTNIGALAHWVDDGVMLFAHNLFTLEPLHRAKVTLHSNKNQLLAIGHTDEQGILRMSNLDKTLGSPEVAVIEYEDDFSLIELNRRDDDTPEFLPGMPMYDKEAYDACIYADRDLYRPGETVHARWIVRKNYGDALADTPLLLKVMKPNGRVLSSQITNLSAFGTGALDIQTQKQFPTGKYIIMLVVPGSERPVGSYQFSLEEFVPNRMETKVQLPQTIWLAGQAYDILVEARHLFGAPAVDRLSSAKVALERRGWNPKGWEGYTFENDSEFKPDTISAGEKQTDTNGKATFSFSHAAPPDATSPLTATVFAGVFELGGRAVYSTAEAMYFPSELCLGIRASRPAGAAGIEAFVAAVKPDGSPAELEKATVYLEKQVWNYYVRRYYSHYGSNWTKSFDPVDSKEVSLQEGKGMATFDLNDWGYYRLRVVSDKTKQFSTVTFYAYGDRINIVSAARPSLIKLTLDKENYTIGETATLKVESPFDGHGIVTVQGDTLQNMIPVTIQDNVGQLQIPVTEAHFPNVWLEVTVIHAIELGKTQLHPFSSFALASLNVQNPARKLAVAFPDLPEEVRPAGQREFMVHVADDAGSPVEAEVTLAAVDEGIHDITNYQNPAPYDYFSRPRRPDYRRAHYYDKVAYDFEKPESGGDALRLLAKRSGAADENWIKPVALWSGVVRTGVDGSAKVLMDVPEFSGQLRLVAVACTASAAGASGDSVFVRRPYMLPTSLPRFLLPGDKATSKVVLFNTTGEPCQVQLTNAVTGPLQISGEPKTVGVPANGEASIEIALQAAEAVGQGNIHWEAVVTSPQGAEVERLVQETPLPVKPAAAYQSYHEMTGVAPGASQTFKNTRFLANEQAEIDIVVSANPQIQLYEALKYLVHYPYGCVEQTTSALMPMYLLRKSQGLADEVLKDQARLNDYIQGGIGRLFSMQTASGGLGYWPGSDEPYPYGSVYGLHFLTLVKNGREFELPEQPIEALQDYVRGIANDWTQKESQSNLYLRAYATYVLALGGDINAIHQIRRFDNISMPRSARYLLAAALAKSTEDKDRVAMYLTSTPSQAYEVAERGGTLNSDIRNTAVEVLSLAQIDPNSPDLHAKAKDLIQYLSSDRTWNTQERAFVVSALSDYLESLGANADQASATIAGPNGQQQIQGRTIFREKHEGAGGEYIVANNGQSTVFVNVTTAGIPEKPDTDGYAEDITIGRRYFTSQGAPYAPENAFLQSDSYVVELTVTPKQSVENVVVVDKLPAGFEIENPRLNAETLPPGKFKEVTNPSYVDVRDDRIVLAFNNLESKAEGHRYYYVVRAVTPGAYQAPSATAECMYDASVRAANAVSNVEVKSRQ